VIAVTMAERRPRAGTWRRLRRPMRGREVCTPSL
jgi:hypothetical protein